MGEHSKIEWTDHTFNPWIGCTKVGPGCDHCYAENWNARFGAGIAPNWGPGAPRRRTTSQNWNKVRKWDREASVASKRPRVFCASLADVFDNEVPVEWRADLWILIEECSSLDWILVTKRVGNVAKMAPIGGFPRNVIILATIVNQPEADRDVPKLLALKSAGIVGKIGVSYEPALGPVNWRSIDLGEIQSNGLGMRRYERDALRHWMTSIPASHGCKPSEKQTAPSMSSSGHPSLDWLIVGGESNQGKHKARPFQVSWARNAILHARGTGCAVFIKQLGSNPVFGTSENQNYYKDKAGGDPSEWPADVQVREFPFLDTKVGLQ
jgi:protein gp37